MSCPKLPSGQWPQKSGIARRCRAWDPWSSPQVQIFHADDADDQNWKNMICTVTLHTGKVDEGCTWLVIWSYLIWNAGGVRPGRYDWRRFVPVASQPGAGYGVVSRSANGPNSVDSFRMILMILRNVRKIFMRTSDQNLFNFWISHIICAVVPPLDASLAQTEGSSHSCP